MSKGQSHIMQAIIFLIDDQGEVQGTERLALALNALNMKSDVISYARRLQASGQITIIRSCGGRGNQTVYKRNRNQPGIPRRLPR